MDSVRLNALLLSVASLQCVLTSVLIAGATVLCCGLSAAGHTLIVEGVQVERVGAGGAAEGPGPTAGATRCVAWLAHLRGWVIVL